MFCDLCNILENVILYCENNHLRKKNIIVMLNLINFRGLREHFFMFPIVKEFIDF